MQIVSEKERKIKMDKKEFALNQHEKWNGKIEVISRAKIETPEDLAVAYTPGVAEPCLKIAKDVDLSYKYTRRGNLVAVVTDGTAVLGLGDIGPEAGMPVMEGKCALFKEFGDVDAFPLCIRSKDVDEIVNTVALLAGSFGGINLEDISAPRCFEIERKLKERCDIPVFHDDQHGTAVVTAAALLNALKFTGRKIEDIKVVMSGAGAAGSAIIKLLIELGLKNVIMCDRKGAIYEGREGLNEEKAKMAAITNREKQAGSLADVLKGADVFIGVSAPGTVTEEMVKTMAKDPILFPMANPVPEIMPDLAMKAGAAVVGTGRSDFPNQINNVLAFPGIFRGALDVRAKDINDPMNAAAAHAIANLIDESELRADYIIPDPFDPRVKEAVSAAVAKVARETGAARIYKNRKKWLQFCDTEGRNICLAYEPQNEHIITPENRGLWRTRWMADYHRFVAYIYEYVNGKKMQNTGFAKIELRNAICRIQIHIQNIRMLDGKTEVFGIVRQPKESRKNNPIILLIGEGQTQGSGFDRRFTVPEEPFVEESCRFEQV